MLTPPRRLGTPAFRPAPRPQAANGETVDRKPDPSLRIRFRRTAGSPVAPHPLGTMAAARQARLPRLLKVFPARFDDHAIRIAAGNWLREQADRYGPELEWSLLASGFRFRDERIPLVNQRGIWKPRHLGMPLSIRTSPSNPYRDSFDPETLLLHYRYFGSDPEHADNAGLRELIGEQRPVAYFHGIREGRYLAVWPAFIVADDPAVLTFTVAVDHADFARDQWTAQREGSSLAAAGDRELERRYATRTTLARIHQRVFRDRVLRAYRSRCAFCRLRREPLLDAAHIVPDRDPSGDPVVPNGLSLCKIHHAAFDGMFLGVTPKGVIHVRPDLLREKDGPMLRHGLQGLHEQPIHRPRRAADHPDPDRLDLRYREFRQAS